MNESTLRQAGIDYDAALARFVGKREIYEKYLLKFLDDTHADVAVQAYEAGDFEDLLEQTHALKGVAGTLGMTKLFEITADIVNDLRNQNHENLAMKMEQMTAERKRLGGVLQDE